MVAVVSDIKIGDGYFNVYPLSYKKKFRKIIEDEIENNYFLKKNFDTWGSRLMITYKSDESYMNNKIKFKEAKKIGIDFVISKYKHQTSITDPMHV